MCLHLAKEQEGGGERCVCVSGTHTQRWTIERIELLRVSLPARRGICLFVGVPWSSKYLEFSDCFSDYAVYLKRSEPNG